MESGDSTRKNRNTILCQYCPSVILRPNSANFINKEEGVFLPFLQQKKKANGEKFEMEGEKLNEFWMVSDMYDFENIGFCNTVDNIKYLACADCERGPVGSYVVDSKEFLVSLKRTKTAPEAEKNE
uniref:guanine nucleotide exchange factor MSS4-like n=1 Tax=Styela clava TaxID=7725 RepID=UPI001939F82C|nr:guanine nucleotide exchange factor MSS4-like [Styela clava]